MLKYFLLTMVLLIGICIVGINVYAYAISSDLGGTVEKSVGTVDAEQESNGKSLKLNGNGFLLEKSDPTNNIKHMTLSIWVKPNYTEGSAQFTIISKEKSFALSINNNVQPYHVATFSIFDGMRWNDVESKSAIPEEWTHLAATFDGSSIGLYVDGNLESTYSLPGVTTVSTQGQISTEPVESLNSQALIAIGASVDSTRGVIVDTLHYSGLINGVGMYGTVLDDSQIRDIYSNNSLVNAQANSSVTLATPALSWNFESVVPVTQPTQITNATGLFGAMLPPDPPLQQIKAGTAPQDVQCDSTMQLIFSPSDGSPICVTPSTAQSLVARGWAIQLEFQKILGK